MYPVDAAAVLAIGATLVVKGGPVLVESGSDLPAVMLRIRLWSLLTTLGRGLRNVELVSVGEDGAESHMNILEARSGGEPIGLTSGVMNELPEQDGERYRLEVRTIEPITSKTFRLVQRNQARQ